MEEMREKQVTMASSPAYTMLFTYSPLHGSFGLLLIFWFSASPPSDRSRRVVSPPAASAIFSEFLLLWYIINFSQFDDGNWKAKKRVKGRGVTMHGLVLIRGKRTSPVLACYILRHAIPRSIKARGQLTLINLLK